VSEWAGVTLAGAGRTALQCTQWFVVIVCGGPCVCCVLMLFVISYEGATAAGAAAQPFLCSKVSVLRRLGERRLWSMGGQAQEVNNTHATPCLGRHMLLE
jgi:hypothetical protein